MNESNIDILHQQIQLLQNQLEQQKKITSALTQRVKRNLKFQLTTNETFEHNSLLLDQLKNTKIKLLQEAKATQRYTYLARHDTLTGLYNRDEFKINLKQSVINAKQNKSLYALFFLDLDQFKVINDTAGHLAGDEMIKQLSSILLTALEPKETLARLGGDEFGLLKEDCDENSALNKARQLLNLINQFHFYWDDKLFSVSASIGVVLIDEDTENHIEAYKNVDIACYAAKNSGRNRVHLFHQQDDNLLQQNIEMQWVPKLTNALENNLFCLYAQPIKPTNPEINHLYYEVLVRLKEGNDIILPGVFLPPAERYNLITKIDLWVIKNTLIWLSENIDQFDPSSYFSINLSGQTLGDESLLHSIIRSLRKYAIDGHRIHFEVTETMAISNLQIANNFIKEVKKIGCGFSLDDFGSGLSSLSYLKNLDVDRLKVDGVFIRDIIKDPIDEEMVSSINNIGHVMGMKTVAEYVENDAIAEKLIKMGFDYLQGNAIGKPKPLSEILG